MSFKDIYYEPSYGKLCEITDHGTMEVFLTDSSHGTIRNMFIKKSLPKELDPTGSYFDISTPYGYGGPIILSLTGDKDQLIKDYEAQFTAYCKANHILCEFVRFHPLLENHADFKAFYHPEKIRQTVVTEIDAQTDPYETQFSKSARKKIRRAQNHNLHIDIIRKPEDLSVFKEIYYDTMDRNGANDYYYFDDAYFDYLKEHLNEHLVNINIYNDDYCIASGLYFYYDEIMQIHLSGTRKEFLHMSPAYLLRYHAIIWAKNNHIRFVHHGGGTDNDPDNPLLDFKKKFTKSPLLDFYVGSRIYQEEKYQEFVQVANPKNLSYFPQYRG